MRITLPTLQNVPVKAEKAQELNALIVKCALVASLGALLFGFDTAVISGATEALTNVFSLNEESIGLTVAIAIVGTGGGRYGGRWS